MYEGSGQRAHAAVRTAAAARRAFFVLLAGALILSGCSGSSNISSTDGALVIGMTSANLPSPTPGGYTTEGWTGESFVGFQLYDGLTRLDLNQDKVGPRPIPGLAISWTPSPDLTTWTFKLRPDVKFTDGTPWNADAAIYGMARILDAQFSGYNANDAGLLSYYISNIASYKKIDNSTISVTTKTPDSLLPESIAWLTFGSPTALAAKGADFANAPVGTGPFKFVSMVPGQSLTMEPNTDYWGDVPKVKKVVLRPIPDANARVTALRSGEVNWIETPLPNQIKQLKADGFNVTQAPYSHIWAAVFDTTKGPLQDKRVREALNLPVDRSEMAESVVLGTGTPAQQYIPRSDLGYSDSNNALSYDPMRAKALLTEAGYGNGITLSVAVPASGSGNMIPVPMSQLLQAQLAKVGVNLELKQIEWSAMLTDYFSGKFSLGADAEIQGFGFAPPDAWGTVFGTGQPSNIGKFSSPEFDALYTQLKSTLREDQQAGVFQQMNRVLIDQAPWLVVVSDLGPRVLSPSVKGFVQPKAVWVDLSHLTVE